MTRAGPWSGPAWAEPSSPFAAIPPWSSTSRPTISPMSAISTRWVGRQMPRPHALQEIMAFCDRVEDTPRTSAPFPRPAWRLQAYVPPGFNATMCCLPSTAACLYPTGIYNASGAHTLGGLLCSAGPGSLCAAPHQLVYKPRLCGKKLCGAGSQPCLPFRRRHAQRRVARCARCTRAVAAATWPRPATPCTRHSRATTRCRRPGMTRRCGVGVAFGGAVSCAARLQHAHQAELWWLRSLPPHSLPIVLQNQWKQVQKEDAYRISGMVFNTFIFMQARGN